MADLLSAIAGPLVSGVSNLLGGALSQGNTASNVAQQEAYQTQSNTAQEAFQTESVANQEAYNTEQVQQQEAYQTQMSNTAYQRATADMTKAGINPMLAYAQGGASTPQGSSASASAPSGSSSAGASFGSNVAPNLLGNSVSSALDTVQQIAQVANTNAQTRKTNYDADIKSPEADLMKDLDGFVKGLLPSVHSAYNVGKNPVKSTLAGMSGGGSALDSAIPNPMSLQ